MNTITIQEDEIEDITEGDDTIEGKEGSWRWGKTREFIFPRNGKFWLILFRYHVQEGLQKEGPYTAVEVEEVEVTVKKWVPVKS
jgi:hypothetical protein